MKKFKLLITIIAALASLTALADGPSSRNAAARRARQEQAARDLQAAQEAQAALERQVQEQQATIERMAQERQAEMERRAQEEAARIEQERLEEQRAAIAANERSATTTTGLTPVAPTTAPRSPLTDWNSSQRREASQDRARRRTHRSAGRDGLSMIDVGVGTERALRTAGVEDLQSGWNVLISIQAQALGGDRRTSRGHMIMHIDGEVAINPSNSGQNVPYLDIELIPYAWTFGNDDLNVAPPTVFGLEFARVSAHRDVRLDRDLRVSIGVIGADVRHRAEIHDNIDFIVSAAAHILGLRVQDSHFEVVRPTTNAGDIILRPRSPGLQIADVEAALSILFHSRSRALSARLTFGGRVDAGMARTNNEDPVRGGSPTFYNPNSSDDPTRIRQSDLNAFGEVGVQLSHYLEVYTRVSITQLRENGWSSPAITRSITQFMTGASLQF